jgi:uncharacterized membrane protein YbhN (UPF0104 family)
VKVEQQAREPAGVDAGQGSPNGQTAHLLRRWAPRALGIALFAWALQRVGLAQVWATLAGADPRPLAPALLSAVPFVLLKSWRWTWLCAGLALPLARGAAFRFYAIGLWTGLVTPGQAGDFLKAWYLRARGAPLSRALLSCLLDRLFDLLALFGLGAVALLAVAGGAGGALTVALATLAVCVALAAAMTARWRAPVLALLGRATPRVARAWLARNEGLRSLATARLDARALAPTLALTALAWVLSLARVYLAFVAVGVRLPALAFLAVVTLATLAGLISVGGIGTRDAMLLVLAAPYGYSEGQALAMSFLILALHISNVIPGFFIWLREPLPDAEWRMRNAE